MKKFKNLLYNNKILFSLQFKKKELIKKIEKPLC